MYQEFKDNNIYDAEGQLGVITGVLNGMWERHQKIVKTKEVERGSDLDAKIVRVLDLVNDLPMNEAMGFISAMANAIQVHRYEKTKQMTVGDLEIILLD